MVRKSEGKLIKNQSRYGKLRPQYLNVIDDLSRKYPVVEDNMFSDLVNFKTNKGVPRHSWFTYKQGYSEKLVRELLLEEKPSKKDFVLDPFAGVGTTNVVAQNLGYKSIGFDINPVATFAAKVKTTIFTKREIDKMKESVLFFSHRERSQLIPNSSLLETSFDKEAFDKLMRIKGFFESLKNKRVQSFFKLAYLSIVEDVSNRLKDGNGIKIARNKRVVEDVYSYYVDRCKTMLEDVYKFNSGEEPSLINGSLILEKDFNKIKGKKVGIVIFSPPYANCFDYCEVYKLELGMGDFVKKYEDFKEYRNMAVRSHVNSTFDHYITNRDDKVDLVANMIACFNIWNKNIPDMVRGYFDDMTKTFKKMQVLMVKGARCFIVVANSGYRGILVPSDLLLADIASKNGFKLVKIIYARKIRASSQQMKELHNGYKDLMRESIVVLEKK